MWLSGLSANLRNERSLGSIPSHMPGLQARSPVGGVQEATNRYISDTLVFLSPSLSPFLPLSLKVNK